MTKKILDDIHLPLDLRKLSISHLKQVSDELREETISKVSLVGGHLGAGLGVVELTVALHYVFDTPKDKIVWDIGHQAYPHKILTGRKNLMHTIRQPGGLSGFLKRTESPYDTFGAGHSSTSISAALGMAVARDLLDLKHHVVAVIGDGALTSGMAYEAMNNAFVSKMIVVLNDNDMSIAPNVGAMKNYLSKLMSSKPALSIRSIAKNIVNSLPHGIEEFAKKTGRYAKDLMTGGNFFEEMGFHYVGPLDGHDVETLVTILKNLKEDPNIESPILLHIKTEKGKGFKAEFSCNERYHAVQSFDLITRQKKQTKNAKATYTKVFGQALVELAKKDEKIVAITAAMPSGTGVNIFQEYFPDRTFDVGIAEQHAVTFAAGLAAEGLKPVVAIYSTFLQRAYDQLIHDVAIQGLPVRFILDRAGLVGADGATHAGVYDLAYLGCIPSLVIMSPANAQELSNMLATVMQIDDKPSVIRYPRSEIDEDQSTLPSEILEIGKAQIVQDGSKVAIISFGTRLAQAQIASEQLYQKTGIKATIINARFFKPLDTKLLRDLATSHEIMITIEEGSIGGFGSMVANFLINEQLMFRNGFKFKALALPDIFIDHGNIYDLYEKAGLNASGILQAIYDLS